MNKIRQTGAASGHTARIMPDVQPIPFPALELEVKRKIMSEHSSETGIQFQNLNRIRISVPEQNLHQKNRQNRLAQISRKCDQSSLDSKHTQGIVVPALPLPSLRISIPWLFP